MMLIVRSEGRIKVGSPTSFKVLREGQPETSETRIASVSSTAWVYNRERRRVSAVAEA